MLTFFDFVFGVIESLKLLVEIFFCGIKVADLLSFITFHYFIYYLDNEVPSCDEAEINLKQFILNNLS